MKTCSVWAIGLFVITGSVTVLYSQAASDCRWTIIDAPNPAGADCWGIDTRCSLTCNALACALAIDYGNPEMKAAISGGGSAYRPTTSDCKRNSLCARITHVEIDCELVPVGPFPPLGLMAWRCSNWSEFKICKDCAPGDLRGTWSTISNIEEIVCPSSSE